MESRMFFRAQLRLLGRLRRMYGDLNTAHVAIHLKVNDTSSVRSLALDVGLSRSAVRRAIQKLSESDTPKAK